MTELRDARFKKALETAPDSHARPAPAVAEAIRAAARQALPAAAVAKPPASWWQRLWHSTAQPRAPWNAAFATVLLAVLVTVLWVREPVPDARPVAPPSESAAPPAPNAPVAATESVPQDASADRARTGTTATTATATTATPPVAYKAKAAPAVPGGPTMAPPETSFAKRAAGTVAATSTAAESAAEPAAAPVVQRAQSLALDRQQLQKDGDAAHAAGDAAYASRQRRDTNILAQAQPLRPDAERAVAPMAAAPAPALGTAASMAATPAPPPGAFAAPAAAAAAAPASARPAGLEAWTALSVEMEGRAVSLDRARGRQLFADMQRLALRMKQLPTPMAEPPASAPTLRLSILSQGQTLAVMELWDETARWRRPAQADVWASISAAELQALLQWAHQAQAPAAPE